jgi:NAD(P) transhydrogenase subunit alpha
METRPLTVGVPRESFPGETRIALVPQGVPLLRTAGLEVIVEDGAGDAAGYPGEAFVEHGAELVSRDEAFGADLLLQVRTLGANPDAGREDLDRYRPGQIVVGMGEPLSAAPALADLAARGSTVFAMELIPRIARAQSMDVLSSQSTIAGYKAVLLAATRLTKIFPMLTTAAGTVAPARVFVIGAGVAGLQAIATARRLGAMVEAYDVRPAAQEEVESLGAKLVPLPLQPGDAEDASGYAKELGEAFYRRQQEHLTRMVAGVDVVVANAAIPGARAPILLTEEGVDAMAVGSVVVDLAAARGGNCALTRPDEMIVAHGVTICGPTNLPATVPFHASQLFSRNLTNFVRLVLMRDGRLEPAWDDDVVRATLVAHDGEVVHPQVRAQLEEVAVS